MLLYSFCKDLLAQEISHTRANRATTTTNASIEVEDRKQNVLKRLVLEEGLALRQCSLK